MLSATAVLLMGLAAPACAGFVVSVEDLSLGAGSSGVVKVFVQSDNAQGDALNLFQAQGDCAILGNLR